MENAILTQYTRQFLLFALLFLSFNASATWRYVTFNGGPPSEGSVPCGTVATTNANYNITPCGFTTRGPQYYEGTQTFFGVVYEVYANNTPGGDFYEVRTQSWPMGVACNGENFNSTGNWNYNESTNLSCFVPEPVICESGTVVSSGTYPLGTDETAVIDPVGCSDSCIALFNGSGSAVYNALEDGVLHYWAEGSFVLDGTQCTGGEATPPSTQTVSTSTCPTGQEVVDVSGVLMCQYEGATTYDISESTFPATDGSGDSITVRTATSSDGSEVVKTTVTAPDGSTNITLEGSTPSAITTFCGNNPSDSICTGESTVATNIETLGDSIDGLIEESGQAPEVNESSIFSDTGMQIFIDNIPTIPSPSSVTTPDFTIGGGGICTTQAGQLAGVNYGLDICSAVDFLRDALYWFFAMFTIIYIFIYATSLNRGSV